MRSIKIRYIVLAKSIPEYSKRDETCYTCSLGFSPELGLIRVYPLPIKSMNKWDIYEINVERNPQDKRNESWKLSSYAKRENWVGLDESVKFMGKCNPQSIFEYLKLFPIRSIKELNDNKESVGFVGLKEYNVFWDINDRFIDTTQVGMFEDVEIADFTKYTKETKRKEARISFRDKHGEHNIQYNEWGVYEYQRKFNANNGAFRFLNNMDLLLVGNMHNHRNVWIGLSMFKSRVNQLSIFENELQAINW